MKRLEGLGPRLMLEPDEAVELARLAHGNDVLEIGAWKGTSTVYLASQARMVVSVDWHQGDAEIGRQDTFAAWLATVKEYGTPACKVIPIVGRFEDVLPLLRRETFDLIYIDGAHDFDSVLHDSNEARRLVTEEGVIVWHDGEREPVRKAAETSWRGTLERGPGRLLIGRHLCPTK